MIHDIIIIGAGPAGYSAAIYAARASRKPLLLTGLQTGGQLTITTDVENYPGFVNVQGPELMEHMRAQAEHCGTEIVYDLVSDVDFKGDIKILKTDSGTTYETRSVIIATGAQARWLNLPSEMHFKGFGVSACATCDGFFFRGKDVAVIGGGNSAVEEALYLSNLCKNVYIIHRRDSFRSEKILQKRAFKKDNIHIIWNHELSEILGDDNPKNVTAITIKNTQNGATDTMNIDGVFVAIGHDPATQIFKGHVDMDEAGYITLATRSSQTSQKGIFAAGDVADNIYRQAITAAGMGCMAALDAEQYLADI